MNWLCHVPNAIRSPSSDIGILVMNGRKNGRNTGIRLSVIQCKHQGEVPVHTVFGDMFRHPSSAAYPIQKQKADLDNLPDTAHPLLIQRVASQAPGQAGIFCR